MAAGSTYTPIATQTLGSSQTSVTFSSIPSTYTDLVLVSVLKETVAANAVVQLNNDTGSNYSSTTLGGNSGGPFSARQSGSTYFWLDRQGEATDWGVGLTHFMNYSNTTTYKTVIDRFSAYTSGLQATVGLWRSTSAINSIKLSIDYSPTQSFVAGSTFTLYGIQAA
jgi:hypothetical protein